MQKFAEYLKEYLQSNRIPYKRAATLCGIDRSLLRRYAEGSRIPKGLETVDKIADGLSMPEADKRGLRDSYKRSRMGEKQYRVNEILDDIVCNGIVPKEKNSETAEEKHTEYQADQETVKNLYDKKSITDSIFYILKDAEKIQIAMNPRYPEIMQIMNETLHTRECSIEHIVEISSFRDREETDSIQEFWETLPFLFFCQSYTIYHHYQWARTGKENSDLNFIITEKGVVLFDRNLYHGIFSNQEQYMNYYFCIFRYMKQNCGRCAKNCGNEKKPDYFLEQVYTGKYKKNNIRILYRQGSTEYILIEKASAPKKEIMMEEEGMVHMIRNYILEQN